MCGIIGCVSHSQFHSIDRSVDLTFINHRGPDSSGTWEDPHIKLGHTRLSIIDLSPLGHQPMMSQNQRYCISFNGEIYNYIEIRQELIELGYNFISQSDTEVLLTAFMQWGSACLNKLRGMFAFAIWDCQEKTLFLARDRMGEKPLYYYYDDANFYFASELKALVRLLPTQPKLNPSAVDLFLHYQYVPEPLTPLEGIYKLSAAHFLTVHHPTWQIEIQRYWSVADISPIVGNPADLIRQELERSIELTLRSDVPVGLALSGGIDSSAIAAISAPRYQGTLQAFSIGYPGAPAYDERSQAKSLADRLGLPFFDIELTTTDFVDSFPSLVYMMDDPIADIAAYGHYSVMKAAADRQIKVMLTGVGADELFWGYAWIAKAARLTEQKQQILKENRLPLKIWSQLEALAKVPSYRRLAETQKLPPLLTAIPAKTVELASMSIERPNHAVYQNLKADFREFAQQRSTIYTAAFDRQLPLDNAYQPFVLSEHHDRNIPVSICQILFDTWLSSNCLALGDRVSMATGVETRLPFMDYKLVELAIGLRKAEPDHLLGSKHWLKAALDGILPAEVLNRPKQGFQPPVAEWMRGVISRYLPWLESGCLIDMAVLNGDYLAITIRAFRDRDQNLFLLYKLLLLEIWYRKVVME
jgi:asparagine synthase (glutamine-hydrolysing)